MNAINHFNTEKLIPLHILSANKKTSSDLIKLMIEKKADALLQTEEGLTSIDVIKKNKNVPKNILNEPWLAQSSLVQEIVKNNQFDVEKIKKNFNISPKKKIFKDSDKNDSKPVFFDCNTILFNLLSSEQFSLGAVSLLFQQENLKINLQEEKNFSSFLHFFCDHSQFSNDGISLFFHRKSDPNMVDKSLKTPLHYAATKPNFTIESLKIFVENKANLKLQDEDNRTAFHYAMLNPNINDTIVNYFIEKKSKINLSDKFLTTPFFLACSHPNLSQNLICFMLEKLANPNFFSNKNLTPFHSVCSNDNISVETLR